jgi:hypothetical protein
VEEEGEEEATGDGLPGLLSGWESLRGHGGDYNGSGKDNCNDQDRIRFLRCAAE